MLDSIALAHIPPTLSVYAGLYREVQNAAFLRQQLLDGNSDFEFAFIDAKSALSTTHILAAIFRAITDRSNSRLKSRNVHSEIVLALSPNNNIADSFRKFGVSEKTRHLAVVKVIDVDTEPAKFQQTLQEHVHGQAVEFSDETLVTMSDVAEVRKVYKLPLSSASDAKGRSGEPGESKDGVDEDARRRELETSILGLIALRGAA